MVTLTKESNHNDQPAPRTQRPNQGVVEVLVASRDRKELEAIRTMLADIDSVNIALRAISNGHTDSLHGMEDQPDILIYHQGEQWSEELREFAARPKTQRPELIVIGDNVPATMRAAMKAGARDYIAEPVQADDLKTAVEHLVMDISRQRKEGRCNSIVVMNAKGGSGASLLAANLAHQLTDLFSQRTVLVDLELQFGSPGQYLDMVPKRGLIEALQVADQLDDVAVEGYVLKHKSGLHVLSAEHEDIVIADELAAERFSALLDILYHKYDQLVFDVPRHLDLLTSHVLQQADHVLLVTQQNLTHLRDAGRLITILLEQLALPPERVKVIVNRYQKNAVITLADIKKILQVTDVITVPNDYSIVSESINSGVPLYECARKSAITRSLVDLSEMLSGVQLANTVGLLTKVKTMFKGA